MKFTQFFLILFLLFGELASIQSQNIIFNQLKSNSEALHYSVNSLYKDERGFIWIGSRNGLSLYNGSNIKTYKYNKKSHNNLANNNIQKIAGNGHGKVFLKSSDVISVFDFNSEMFKTIACKSCKTIHYFKGLYIASNNNVFLFNDTTNTISHCFSLPDKLSVISSLYVTNDSIWIGTTNRGLYLKKKHSLKNIIAKANITNIFGDSEKNIWVGSWENGAYKINNKKIVNFKNDIVNPNSISSNFVRDFCEDNEGNIWLGTVNGICKYNKGLANFTNFYSNDNPGSLSHSSVWTLIKDNQGTIWIGTYFGGVNYFNPEYEIFTRYKSSLNNKKDLSSPIIGMMTEDKYKNLWICTDGGGLNFLDRKNKTFKTYLSNNTPNSISHNNVKALYYDEKKEIMWIGTHLGGLNKLDIKSGKITQYKKNNNDTTSIISNILSCIIPYHDQLLLATHSGICTFNPKTGKASAFQRDAFNGRLGSKINFIHLDKRNTLWVAGKNVFSYNFNTKKWKEYIYKQKNSNGICSNNITAIFEDSNQNLWFCSEDSGFDRYRPEKDDFENFDVTKNGIISDCIYNICDLQPGKLLISTDKGLSVFNLKNREFVNYGIKTGIPLNTTNSLALYKTSDDEVFVGGVDGLISFKADKLIFEPKPYEIFPFRLFVNGNEVHANDDTKILQNSISATKEITLKSTQSVFSIEFTTTNYVPLNKTEIIYKLEGFSDVWNTIQGQNIITYTNLNPGTYTLIIKPKYNKNLCNESRLIIHVLPPFYKTIWAYILYFIIFALIANYLNNIYKTRIRLKESIKYEQKRIEDIEKLNQSKLSFFTNISHEFRTPLTLIIGQLEMLLQAKSFIPNIYNRILSVYNNSLQLRELITELLDFRKQELGEMKILVSENNIVDFLSENFHLFQEYAKNREVTFKLNTEIRKMLVWYDAKQMQKVVNNLLSNAFKITEKGGTISINLKDDNDYVTFNVSDSGSGIDPKDIHNIFELFYQSDNNERSSYSGTGIGLTLTRNIIKLHKGEIDVKSSLGKGTSFIVKLKKGNSHFSDDQICMQTEEDRNSVKQCEQYTDIQNLDIDFESSKIKGAKLLVIEDNKSLREMLKNIFDPFYDVHEAENGEAGLEKANEIMPDIIVSDVLMPKMSGIELCKAIKSDINTCHIPVVLLTALKTIEHNLEGLRIGADDYITKPFNVNLLLTRCNNLLNSRIVLQEKFSNLPQTPMHMLATNAMDKEIMDKATIIIEKYIDDCDFNIDTFAQEMGMARTKLFSKIKAITGQTPFDFISTVRLKKAAVMLKYNPELNISEISERLGFNTPRYFSKCFKDKYHVIPLSYRKNYQAELKNNT